MKRNRLLALAVATAALSGPAFAADISPIVIPAPVVVPPPVPTIAGYIDLHFGAVSDWEDTFIEGQFDRRDDWRSWVLGGSGRGAAPLGSVLNVQLDAWYNMIMARVEPTPASRALFGRGADVGRGGIGMHLFADTAGGFNIGGLATVGVVTDFGMFVNVGGEASTSFGNFTVATQAGYTFAINGEAAAMEYRAMYVRGGATAYLGPNTSISANVGFSRTTVPGWDEVVNQLSWGARAEHKLGSSPFTIFASYAGYRWNIRDQGIDVNWTGMEHAFVVGVRMLFGRDTLQALDAAVPFADYNPVYGDPFIR